MTEYKGKIKFNYSTAKTAHNFLNTINLAKCNSSFFSWKSPDSPTVSVM